MHRLLALTFLLGSCGDNNGSNGTITTVSDYYRVAIPVLCQYFIRCGTFSSSQSAACQTLYAAQIDGTAQLYSYDQAVTAGRLGFDAAAARSCLAIIPTAGCDLKSLLSLGTNNACGGVLQPLVPPGGSCKADPECQNGFCEGSSALGCPGTCRAFAATGASCAGTRCASTDLCSSSICVARGAQNAACSSSLPCAPNLYCRNLTCQPAAAEGAACAGGGFNDDCQTGLYCDTPLAMPICKRRVGTGQSCTSDSHCQDGLRCGAAGTCQATADIGESCAVDPCAGDATCDATLGTCQLDGQLGDPCSTGCSANLYCGASNRCEKKISVGGACQQTSQCAAGECSASSKTCTLVCI